MNIYNMQRAATVSSIMTSVESSGKVSSTYLKQHLRGDAIVLFEKYQPLSAFNKFMSSRNVERAVVALQKVYQDLKPQLTTSNDYQILHAKTTEMLSIISGLKARVEAALLTGSPDIQNYLESGVVIDHALYKTQLIILSECPLLSFMKNYSKDIDEGLGIVNAFDVQFTKFDSEDHKKLHYEWKAMDYVTDMDTAKKGDVTRPLREMIDFVLPDFLISSPVLIDQLTTEIVECVDKNKHRRILDRMVTFVHFQMKILTDYNTFLDRLIHVLTLFFAAQRIPDKSSSVFDKSIQDEIYMELQRVPKEERTDAENFILGETVL